MAGDHSTAALRTPTWDLREGLALVRWGDTEADVAALYPRAQATLAVHGKEAESRQPIVVPPGLVIEDLVALPGSSLTAGVGFAERRVVGLDLYPRGLMQQLRPHLLVRQALIALGERLGLPIGFPLPQPSSWAVGAAVVDLHFHSNSFTVAIYAPGSETLGRRTQAHRAYRQLQTQRCIRDL